MLDGSGSVGSTDFSRTKTFVQYMVDLFNVTDDGTRVGVIQYASSVNIEFNLNEFTDEESLRDAIAGISYMGGGTDTERALQVMGNQSFLVENGARPAGQGSPRVAVVITDGQSQGAERVGAAADKAREMDIVIFAIGVTNNVNVDELNAIANKPNETYVFHVSDYDAIGSIGAILQTRDMLS